MKTWGIQLGEDRWLQDADGQLIWAPNKEQLIAYVKMHEKLFLSDDRYGIDDIKSFQDAYNEARHANADSSPSEEFDSACHGGDASGESAHRVICSSEVSSIQFRKVEVQPNLRIFSKLIIFLNDSLICHIPQFFKRFSHESELKGFCVSSQIKKKEAA